MFIRVLSMLITVLIFIEVKAQTLEAKYKVIKQIVVKGEMNVEKLLASVSFEGFLLQSKNTYLFFEKPLFLKDYPNGAIDYTIENNNIGTYSLCTDSVQNIMYKNLDSQIYRFRIDGCGGKGTNFLSHYVEGANKWLLTTETKKIMGLDCQRAKYFHPLSNQLIWDVWFSPDIPTMAGPSSIVNLPGLVVEAELITLKETYSLQYYQLNSPIAANALWPTQFNEPFIERAKPKAIN